MAYEFVQPAQVPLGTDPAPVSTFTIPTAEQVDAYLKDLAQKLPPLPTSLPVDLPPAPAPPPPVPAPPPPAPAPAPAASPSALTIGLVAGGIGLFIIVLTYVATRER